jgi:hypothetical protein
MNIEELQKNIQKLSPQLYSFAYVLIPDDLQATQLMIDCVQSFIIQKRVLIDKFKVAKNIINNELFEETKQHLFKIVFELSRKRYQQLKISFKDVEENSNFFSLEFDEKTVLYLKDKCGFELNQIEFITSSTKAELMSYLYSARIKITSSGALQSFNDDSLSGDSV